MFENFNICTEMRNNFSAGTYSAGNGLKGSLADAAQTLQQNNETYEENGLGPNI